MCCFSSANTASTSGLYAKPSTIIMTARSQTYYDPILRSPQMCSYTTLSEMRLSVFCSMPVRTLFSSDESLLPRQASMVLRRGRYSQFVFFSTSVLCRALWKRASLITAWIWWNMFVWCSWDKMIMIIISGASGAENSSRSRAAPRTWPCGFFLLVQFSLLNYLKSAKKI
jgi:hypothetical protein